MDVAEDVLAAGEGQGATFTVELPLAPVRVASREAAAQVDAGDAALLDGLRVLVVDDEKDAREVLHALLARSGALVETAASVAEALERLGYPSAGDPAIVAVPSGACGIVALLGVVRQQSRSPHAELGRLDQSTSVMAIVTEGA